MSLTLRTARPDEVAIVSSVLCEAGAWLEARGEHLWDLRQLTPSALATEVANELYVLAFARDEAVGALRFTLEDALYWPEAIPGEAAYVHKLAVRRAWAGGKASSAMLAWTASEARRLGRAYVRLDCRAERRKLRAIYESFGFRYHSDHRVGPNLVARYELPLG
jgi:GNAT superfamily N-acetyltransferase